MITFSEFLRFRAKMKNKRRVLISRIFKSDIEKQKEQYGSEI